MLKKRISYGRVHHFKIGSARRQDRIWSTFANKKKEFSRSAQHCSKLESRHRKIYQSSTLRRSWHPSGSQVHQAQLDGELQDSIPSPNKRLIVKIVLRLTCYLNLEPSRHRMKSTASARGLEGGSYSLDWVKYLHRKFGRRDSSIWPWD